MQVDVERKTIVVCQRVLVYRKIIACGKWKNNCKQGIKKLH